MYTMVFDLINPHSSLQLFKLHPQTFIHPISCPLIFLVDLIWLGVLMSPISAVHMFMGMWPSNETHPQRKMTLSKAVITCH